ncbi:CbrC family protein [Streptomyces werraensis]|uniref:CbrC family protein n=1 Tax=Streptomyces werraensis TaxID=68284 RepID=UPI0037F3923E
MSADLPFFRYHPDPLASGFIRASTETCACCKANRGWIYTATLLHCPGRQRTVPSLVHRRWQCGRTLRRRLHRLLRARRCQ